MNNDQGLLHELWEYPEDGMLLYTFCHAGPGGDGARKKLPTDAKLVWTVWAGSHFEAMTRYYERQGWGTYTTNQSWDLEPYPVEWVQEQQQYFASSSSRAHEALP
jgi:hypothetical protein